MSSSAASSTLDGNAVANSWATRVSQVGAAVSYAIRLGGMITIGISVYLVVVSYSSLPWGDGWAQVDPLANNVDPLSLGWLSGQHDEHRVVITKLFLLADQRLFHAGQIFLLISILTFQFLHLMLLSWSMRALGGWRGALWRTGTGVAAFCLFGPTQWHNFVWGFEVCFVLPGLFATLSFVGLLLFWMAQEQPFGKRSSWRFLALAMAAAVGATCSLANGNLVWVLLVAAALLLRLRWPVVVTFAVAGAVSIGLYLYHYVSPQAQANAVSLREHPFRFLQFVAVYLGTVWVHANTVTACLLGIAGAAVAGGLVLRAPFYVRTRQAFTIQLVLTLLFCIGTGLATALGRSNFGLSYAFSSRYQTVTLLFWCCLGLLLLEFASAAEHPRIPLLLVQLCLLGIMLRGAERAQYPIREARDHGFQLNVASMALLTGVDDLEQFSRGAGVKPRYLMREAPYLKPGRLSIYSGSMDSQLGKPLESVFDVTSPDRCLGALQSATLVEGAEPSALRFTGWAWDEQHGQPPLEVIATRDGVITGLAAVGDWRAVTGPQVKSNYSGYVGYVPDARLSTALKIYAVLQGKPASACYIASTQP